MSVSLNTNGVFSFNTKARVAASPLQNVALLKGRLPQVPSLTQSVTQGRGAQTTIVVTQLPRVSDAPTLVPTYSNLLPRVKGGNVDRPTASNQLPRITDEPALVPTFSNLLPRVKGGNVERPTASNQLPRVTDEPALVPILSNVRPPNDGDAVGRPIARAPQALEPSVQRPVARVPQPATDRPVEPAPIDLDAVGKQSPRTLPPVLEGGEGRFKPIARTPEAPLPRGTLPREIDALPPIARGTLPREIDGPGSLPRPIAANPIEREGGFVNGFEAANPIGRWSGDDTLPTSRFKPVGILPPQLSARTPVDVLA
jgi:hypothetical protein